MRLGKKLIGLKVFALATGEYIAVVRDLLFDPKVGKVAAFVVEPSNTREWPDEDLVLPLASVYKVGEDAVTVENRHAIRPMSEVPEVLQADGDESVIGRSVMTTGGNLLGIVDDILVDTTDGTILGYSLSDGLIKDWVNGQIAIPASQSYYFGQEAMIVPEDTTERIRKVEPNDPEHPRLFSLEWSDRVLSSLRTAWSEEMGSLSENSGVPGVSRDADKNSASTSGTSAAADHYTNDRKPTRAADDDGKRSGKADKKRSENSSAKPE